MLRSTCTLIKAFDSNYICWVVMFNLLCIFIGFFRYFFAIRLPYAEHQVSLVLEGHLALENICISCSSVACLVNYSHPLFEGGICTPCLVSAERKLYWWSRCSTVKCRWDYQHSLGKCTRYLVWAAFALLAM